LDYVAFEVTPSAEDRNEAMQSLLKVAPEFASASSDSDFVNQNADSKFEAQYASRKSLAPQVDTLYNASIGTMIGPYFDGNAFRLAKLSGVRMAPDSVKARHILLKVEAGGVEKAKAKADSLKNLIKAGAKFEDLAKTNSTDQGSAVKGGDLGYFKEGMMVKPFNDACFNGKVGDMPVVESQFGVHLIEITGRGAETRKVLISFVDRQLKASTKTYQEAYQKATRFAGESRTLEQFEANVKTQKLTSMPAQMVRELDRNMGGLENSRLVVKWAYKSNKGDVSEVFDLGNKFVVAALKEVKEKGVLPLEAVRKQVEFEAIRDKKAERFLADLDGKLKRAGSLSALAAEMKVPVDTSKNTSFAAPYLPSGRELGLVGMLSVAKTQTLLKPFKGENGVYVAQIWETTSPTFPSDWKDATDQLSNSLKSRVDYEAFEALKEKADVKDNRANFY
jgi:peptidyl-prolyl cis-trans isomerase D